MAAHPGLSTRLRSARFALMTAATILLVLDALIAMPWTGTVGMPPRMFLVHVLLVAAFFLPSLSQMSQLCGLATIGVVGLALRDLYVPAPLQLVPPDFGSAVGIASTAIWVMSLWFLAQWSAKRRRIDRILARQRDVLTGLYNRDFFDATLRALRSHSNPLRNHVGLLLVDISVAAETRSSPSLFSPHARLLSDVGDYLAGFAAERQLPPYPCYLGCGSPACGQFAVILHDLPNEQSLSDQRRTLEESLTNLLATRTEGGLGGRVMVVSAFAGPDEHAELLVEAAYQQFADAKRKARVGSGPGASAASA